MPDNLIPKVPEIKIEVNSALNKIPLSDDDKNQLKPVLSQLAPDAQDKSLTGTIMNSVASQYKENNGTISVNAVVNDAASLIPRKEDGAIDVAAIGNMAKDRVVEAYEDGKAKALTAKDYITGEKVLEETPIEESEKVTFDRAYKAAMAVFEDARNGTMSLDSMVDSADTITKYIDQTKTTMKNTAIRAFNGIRSGFSKK